MTDTERDTVETVISPYARGGSRDPRIRAVQGVIAMEGALGMIEEQLTGVRQGGRLPRIGRLRLRYTRTEYRYRWKRKIAARRWEDVGARVPASIRRKLRPATREKVDRVERLLDIRESGMTALNLIEVCAQEGAGWTESVVTLRWCGAVPGRVTWSFRLQGGRLCKGGYLAKDGPPREFADDVEQLVGGRTHDENGGPVTVSVKRMVSRLEQIDQRLLWLQAQLLGVIRLYYTTTTDVWQLRQVTGSGWSIYHGKTVPKGSIPRMTQDDNARVDEVVDLLGRRAKVKRGLQVIATVADAMYAWPGGDWQLRGRRGKGLPAAWAMDVTKYGVLRRRYKHGSAA